MRLAIIGIITGAVLFIAGYFTGQNTGERKIKIVKTSDVIYKTVYKDREAAESVYSKLSHNEMAEKLFSYDQGIPILRGEMRGNVFQAEAGLSVRTWRRDFTLAETEGGGWRIYAGIGIAGAAIGGIIAWRVIK